jgi:hypothetical protein
MLAVSLVGTFYDSGAGATFGKVGQLISHMWELWLNKIVKTVNNES